MKVLSPEDSNIHQKRKSEGVLLGSDPVLVVDDFSSTQEPVVEATCDLTAIYENEVFILLDKNRNIECAASSAELTPPNRRKSWFSSPTINVDPVLKPIIRVGTGMVLIDSRK